MAKVNYPAIALGSEGGVPPSKIRVSGRLVTVVGALIDGGKVSFDNGVLQGRSQVEKDINFGPEVLRAMRGRRVLALFLAVVKQETGEDGWFGMTIGEMRIDAASRDGFKDANAFTTKLTESARGRVATFALKDADKAPVEACLRAHPDLWRHAHRTFRDTLLQAIPTLATLDAPAGDGAAAATATPADGGRPPRTLRVAGRDVTILGAVVDGTKAEWDNGLLDGAARVEKGINFGAEPLRAVSGRRVCGLWICAAGQEEGDEPGYFGVTVGLMRIDENKSDGFKDLAAHGVKLNEAARGRVELGRLLPAERTAVAALLKGRADLWEHAAENIRNSLE
jgi:hypothetical protein